MQITANGIQLEVEDYGPKDGVPVVLIRGLGSQLIHWPEEFHQGLAAQGYRVVLFDNRDVGLSQRCAKAGVPSGAEEILALAAAGGAVPAAYGLGDMAADVVGLMDVLNIKAAHIFGMSMGGAITQVLCLDHATRVLSASIVMSAGRPMLARGQLSDLLAGLLCYPVDRQTYITQAAPDDAVTGSPGFPMSEADLHAQSALAFDRGYDAEGINRHVLAVLNAPDRRAGLAQLALPCQVIHGLEDNWIPPELGAEIADLIPGCAHHEIAGMGHVITPKLAPLMVDLLDGFVRQQEG